LQRQRRYFSPFFDRMVGSESTGDYNLEIQDIRENTLEITAILHYLEFRIGIVNYYWLVRISFLNTTNYFMLQCIPTEDILPHRKHKGSLLEDKAY
jgi:hypothetical protein